MGSNSAFSRNILSRRHLVKKSVILALCFFILFAVITLSLLYRSSERKLTLQSDHIISYSSQFLSELTTSMSQLIPLSAKNCEQASSALHYRAAFTNGVRAFLLVRNDIAYCSSATGEMNVPVSKLYPKINVSQPLDFKIQQGTPMMPGKPVIGVWLREAGRGNTGVLATLELTLHPYLLLNYSNNQVNGLAIIIDELAVTTFDAKVIPISQLPTRDAREIQLPGYPIKILIYHTSLTADDIRMTLLGGLLLAGLVGILAYYILIASQSAEAEILRGIRRGEFFVEYQPAFRSNDRSISGLEALIRWQHPIEGRISPDLFIPYAEAQHLIQPLTRHLFELIIKDSKLMAAHVPAGVKLAFNISPVHLTDDNFRKDVTQMLQQLNTDVFSPVFEITERGMVEEELAIEQFAWLRSQGIQIAVDDFGTGHSALIYLERFTLDFIKIDRGFVSTIGINTVAAPVLDAVLMLANKLNIETVAEGVETEQQLQYLAQHGVNYLQGYLLSKPLSVEDLVKFCNKKTS
ncbi:cyclic di-GMP phosphodiesterase [Yersinia enterocolitica]|uniref:cyclic di-GMP phosphodiesterase n=1 Tax=Yersinia enterocolitica TaxID=630 RepID=UPI00065A83E6|nr:cyclic di-GMP phosphodiesterase [Yersinia enterocolitica]PNM09006.1 phage resistance protein [Yersinia enterocolitica]CRY16076.1 rtn protein [Yersinia enterocolitica]HDL8431396.1 cyclic di-GMP phosphodiesterase [Yersinia enterocolitica]HDL8484902.1 cyclic di-GMP phosphodiesterase [Yersinia enterocolitica]HDQ4770641.1 cyclic di-GMP phosphodiesterase [Yersinia enterocolitica]